MPRQTDLFAPDAVDPPGLRLEHDVLSSTEQAELVDRLRTLPFAPFDFQGWKGARRVVSFGSRYDFSRGRIEPADPLPDFLKPLTVRAAVVASIAPEDIAQALVTEYRPGAGIGWHRDRPQYDLVLGLSLVSPCRLRFRRRDGATWSRRFADLAPGSLYVLDGPARWIWEHSIAPLPALRYSITFRTLRDPASPSLAP